MPIGGQFSSSSGSFDTVGAVCAGSSDLPPKRLLKRSLSDCAEADVATPQAAASKTAVIRAMLKQLFLPIGCPCIPPPAAPSGRRYNSAMTANQRHPKVGRRQ